MNPIDEIPELVKSLYKVVEQFEAIFPERKFPLDGHLVGSIGEVIAAHDYNLTLLPAGAECHDATAPDGRAVQIKATQVESVGLRAKPEHLVVLKLAGDGTADEVYNGPGSLAWMHSGKMQKNGQRFIGVSKLRGLMAEVAESDQLPSV